MTTMIKTAYRGHMVPSLRDLILNYDENDAERALAAEEDRRVLDLLDQVPENDTPDLRSPAQVRYMNSLIKDLAGLDATLGTQAQEYTDRMTRDGKWTPGRDGNASAWIDRLKAKLTEVRVSRPASSPDIPAGRYAVTDDGEVKCYKISYGREGSQWAGFLFLDRISSDNLFPIKNRTEKARILAEISEDVTASEILAGITLRQCRRCHRTLSDTKNPYFSVALGPECGTR